MPQAVFFIDNFTIDVVAPFSNTSTTIKLDSTHPQYADLQAWSLDAVTGIGRVAALTITDGTNQEVLTLSGYNAGSDVFPVSRINEVNFSASTNVKAEMRVTAYEMNSILERIVALETSVFGAGSGGS